MGPEARTTTDTRDESLLDKRILAARLSVSVRTVEGWMAYTDVPRVRIGRLVRFRFGEVLRWIEADRASLSRARRRLRRDARRVEMILGPAFDRLVRR